MIILIIFEMRHILKIMNIKAVNLKVMYLNKNKIYFADKRHKKVLLTCNKKSLSSTKLNKNVRKIVM